ncbi:zinc finger protein 28-like [Hydractinia symbiolongicarpus]|uniref:zinc finger protein 28-like n=1 Tax=Hydractinia symbiolongicarpus TaxID=13093 RepID=UPI00254A4B91|nr:zinc finger protein 28-like [Hydractinia symbiolongicarpus]
MKEVNSDKHPDKQQRNKVKPHKCTVCHKAFVHAYTLKEHLKLHTGENIYQCDVCLKEFCQLANLRRHERIHTGEKPFSCKVCEKQFTDRSSLTWHVMTHSKTKPFQCKHCSKSFYLQSHLDRHSSIHESEKKFKCKICGKKLRRVDSLRCHMETHSVVKPFNCIQCNRSYSTKAALNKHLKNHEKQNQELLPHITEQQKGNLDVDSYTILKGTPRRNEIIEKTNSSHSYQENKIVSGHKIDAKVHIDKAEKHHVEPAPRKTALRTNSTLEVSSVEKTLDRSMSMDFSSRKAQIHIPVKLQPMPSLQEEEVHFTIDKYFSFATDTKQMCNICKRIATNEDDRVYHTCI